ncbi:hypothetical protein EGX94_00700 [Propionibacterium acidifaciens]|nr:hypothetical protein EGX94_00700 [Propionibacterium acidifaciens]
MVSAPAAARRSAAAGASPEAAAVAAAPAAGDDHRGGPCDAVRSARMIRSCRRCHEHGGRAISPPKSGAQ